MLYHHSHHVGAKSALLRRFLFLSKQKTSSARSLAPPFQTEPASLGFGLVFALSAYCVHSSLSLLLVAADISLATNFFIKKLIAHSFCCSSLPNAARCAGSHLVKTGATMGTSFPSTQIGKESICESRCFLFWVPIALLTPPFGLKMPGGGKTASVFTLTAKEKAPPCGAFSLWVRFRSSQISRLSSCPGRRTCRPPQRCRTHSRCRAGWRSGSHRPERRWPSRTG